MYIIEHHTHNGNFTTDQWEMVMSKLEYRDNLYSTKELAQAKLTKIAAAYEEPESDYRIVEE